MELYLLWQYCSRGILSQTLDIIPDWRWCMAGEDEACGVCITGHSQARLAATRFEFTGRQEPDAFSVGPAEVVRQDFVQEQIIEQYKHQLPLMAGCCKYCRPMNLDFEHRTGSCSRRWEWIQAKREILQECQRRNKEWISEYTACWRCYQPQGICRVADPAADESECRYPDIVIPLCYGIYQMVGGARWVRKEFGVEFRSVQAYMMWLGEASLLGGMKCIQANRVVAAALSRF